MVSKIKFKTDGFFPGLGKLADADQFNEPLALNDFPPEELLQFLEKMVQIRCAEEKIADALKEGQVKCPCHLVIGQEAVPTALAPHIREGDKVFGAHRSHAHYLALGGDLYKLFAEIQGKDDGCSGGMGGSMHLIDKEHQLFGTVPIVGATIPIATGAGLASKMSAKGEVAVSFLGDGSAEEGVLHESLNLAATMKLPVIYICENNLFSSHLHISLRQPADSIARYADAHCIPSITLDGNDVVSMYNAAEQAVQMCRSGKGPVFIEAVTYRWRGHVGPSEDLDVGVQRKDDLVRWKKRDPIERLWQSLYATGKVEAGWIDNIWNKYRQTCDEQWALAEKAPFPASEELLNRVYTNIK
ncbi:thiamine pyrophosphate-dependent dehydrogenase E1 component subunit alpha [Verrucomicrobia bacterium]|nr:thiamine pyrophosphate-dependent dehydrogenase E1 component subunit alpha [Verrucomicrobiota bacterium]